MSQIFSQGLKTAVKVFREAFETDGDYKIANNGSSFKPTARDKWIGTGAMVVMSVFAIFLGTIHSIKQLKKARKGAKLDSLSNSDVVCAPFFASFLLFSLFVSLKLIPKDYLMTLFSIYVIIFGWFSVGLTFDIIFEYIYAPFHVIRRYKVSVMEQSRNSFKDYVKFDFSSGQIISLLFAAIPCLYYILVKKFWIINNLIGIGICARMISLVHINRFHHIALLMCGLFVYDIFWVFFSNVMVFVAMSIDLPIKLLFPSDLMKNGLIKSQHFSILGLGDIALPGLYLAFLRRFDHFRDKPRASGRKGAEPTVQWSYYWPAIASYVIGLIASSAAVIFYKKSQPALLYLVPCLLITTFLQAVIKHETKDLIAYHDLPQGGSSGKDEEEKSKSQKTMKQDKGEPEDRAVRTKSRSDQSPRRRTPVRRCNATNTSSSKI